MIGGCKTASIVLDNYEIHNIKFCKRYQHTFAGNGVYVFFTLTQAKCSTCVWRGVAALSGPWPKLSWCIVHAHEADIYIYINY